MASPTGRRLGSRVAVVYQNNVILTVKPVQQQLGLQCLHLVLGNIEKV